MSTRVLSLPELVACIFLQLEGKDLTALAPVCRLWADIARVCIPKNSDRKLFNILIPPDKLDVLSYTPRSSHWQSFLKVSQHVKFLTLNIGDRGLSLKVVDIIARTRPNCDLFPQLVGLTWSHMVESGLAVRPEHLLLFLTRSMKHLVMKVPVQSTGYPCNDVFDDIAFRCPRLEYLALTPLGSTDTAETPVDIQKGVCQILGTLPIQTLTVPPYYALTPLLLSAARCITLRALSAVYRRGFLRPGDYLHARELSASSFPPNSFSNLTRLALAAPIQFILDMVRNQFLPAAQLKVLHLRAVQPETDTITRDLLTLLRTRCHELEVFTLILARPMQLVDEISESWPASPRNQALRFDTLQHLRFPLMIQLEIVHEYNLALTDDELVSIVTTMPHLTILQLNAAPAHPEPGRPTLTLHAIHRIAPILPKLESLSLFVDATRTTGLDAVVVHPFKFMRCIWLHWSLIEADARKSVARFLTRVLPAHASLVADLEYPSNWDYMPLYQEGNFESYVVWDEISQDIDRSFGRPPPDD